MDPVTMMLISMIPGLVQLGVGAFQGIKGNQLGSEEQPMMEIPDSIKQMLETSKNLAGQREAPGSRMMKDRIGTDSAAAMSNLLEATAGSGSALGGVGEMTTNTNRALQEQGARDDAFYQTNQGQLLAALEKMGGWQQKQWETNIKEPFDRTMDAAAAMKQGAIQNIYGGISQGIGGALGAAKLNMLYGNGNGNRNNNNSFSPDVLRNLVNGSLDNVQREATLNELTNGSMEGLSFDHLLGNKDESLNLMGQPNNSWKGDFNSMTNPLSTMLQKLIDSLSPYKGGYDLPEFKSPYPTQPSSLTNYYG